MVLTAVLVFVIGALGAILGPRLLQEEARAPASPFTARVWVEGAWPAPDVQVRASPAEGTRVELDGSTVFERARRIDVRKQGGPPRGIVLEVDGRQALLVWDHQDPEGRPVSLGIQAFGPVGGRQLAASLPAGLVSSATEPGVWQREAAATLTSRGWTAKATEGGLLLEEAPGLRHIERWQVVVQAPGGEPASVEIALEGRP